MAAEENKTVDETVTEEVTAETTDTDQREPNEIANKIAPAYRQATKAYNYIMDPVRELTAYVDKKNELDVQYAEQLESEDYKNAVKELQTGCFGDNATKIAIADKFESVHDFSEKYGITAVGHSLAGVAGNLKDAFMKSSTGQKVEQQLEDIKLAAAELEEEDTDQTQKSEKETEENLTASADVTSEEKAEKIDKSAGVSSDERIRGEKNARPLPTYEGSEESITADTDFEMG